MRYFIHILHFVVCYVFVFDLVAQEVTPSGQSTGSRVVSSAVPFLSIAPDARSNGLGFTGVATTSDGNSVFWNNAKLPFNSSQWTFSASYLPWLSKITDDMYLASLAGSYKIDGVQTLAASLRYFDQGNLEILDGQAQSLGSYSPNEFAIDFTYARKLTEEIGAGLTIRYIQSNVNDITNQLEASETANSIAIDIGSYYTKTFVFGSREVLLNAGAHLSNFGPKISYLDDKYFLPVNLRVGSSISTVTGSDGTITVSLDFNKLLVPTPPMSSVDPITGDLVIIDGQNPQRSFVNGFFGSFSDAPGGLSEELNEVSTSIGLEYKYQELLSFRVGYFGEHKSKGNRRIVTTGLGLQYKNFGLDLAYLIPTVQDSPLTQTILITLSTQLGKVKSRF